MNLSNIKIYSIGLIAMAGITISACSDTASDPEVPGNGAIQFIAQTTQEAPENSSWAEGAKVALRANGKNYSYTLSADGSLTASGTPLVWEGDNFTVHAWTPDTDRPVVLTDQTTAGKMAACDLLSADAEITSRYSYLMFNHRMTLVEWDFRSIDPSYTTAQVNAAKVTLLGYGSVNFTNGEVTATGNPTAEIASYETTVNGKRQGRAIMAPAEMWSLPLIHIAIGGDEYTYTPDRGNTADAAAGSGDLVAGKVQKYHITISRKTLSVEMESNDVEWGNSHEFGNGDIADASLLAEIAADVTSKPGYTVTGLQNGYITDRNAGFSISYTEEGLGGLTWTGSCKVTRTETSVTGSSTASVQTYTFTDCKTDISVTAIGAPEPGDYVYDNGTWGKDESRYGCTAIGRVFRAGRDANDDSDYDLCKVRGYVVPLTFANTTPMKWFVNQNETKYIDALSNIPVSSDVAARESYYGGYRLTGLLDADLAPFSADWASQIPFWYAFKNIGMTAPDITSSWYIPTFAQLKDVCTSKMYAAFSNVYWSSQVYPGTGNAAVGGVEEGVKTILWAIRCTDGASVGYGWAIDEAKLLVVLTF